MAEHALIGVATAAAKVLADWVAARALDEISLDWGFKDQLLKLKEKFEYIQAFLDDANSLKHAQKSRLVKLWVQKVKDAAYLADDVMDEYAIEIFRRKMEPKNPIEELGNFFTPSNSAVFHHEMARKVKEILSLFDEIDKDAKNIGLNKVDIVTHNYNYDDHLSQIRRHAAVTASEFIEREDDQKLLDFICSPINYEEPVMSTVAIVGMGGVGKTTLTRHLYDHERICANFGDKKIWICVSQNFDIIRLLNEMVESVTSRKSELSNSDAVIRKLQEELNGKKLLLVFDDVWNDKQDSWCCLIEWLNRIGTLPGSVILINTRNDEVAKAAGAVFKRKLEGLSADKSWFLFHKIVSNNGIQSINSSLEDVGRRIVEKCKSVPLAIKVMGGLLQSKHDLDEWEAIEKSELWDLPYDKNQILPSLLLSFNNLPSPSLKQCFAYYPMVMKGFHMNKSELIGFWLSQGYLRNDSRKNLTVEEIGEEYLKILLSNSLLEEYVPQGLEIVCYTMHHLVFDLAVYVSGSDLLKEAKDLCEVGVGVCRHLVINSGKNKTTLDFPPEKALTKLRTIRFVGTVPWNLLSHTRYLRTLFLARTGITEVPPAIELLKHLRYLDVSYNPISTLPDSIGKLYQLQTRILQDCKNMKKLPKVVNKLVNLRHISTTTPMFACKGLQQLTNLKSLPSLCLDSDQEGWTIDELGDLDQLRDEIHILCLEFVKDKEQARKAGLAGKANVTNLNLSWTKERGEAIGCFGDEDVLEGLEPHPNLTSLEVHDYNGARFPIWITVMAVLTEGPRGFRTQLNKLTTVKLLNCSKCQTLPKLGHLPLLECLILSGLYVELIGIEFYGGDDLDMLGVVSFQSLIDLEISGFPRLTSWMEPPKASFPSLKTIRVRDCRLLKSIPAFFKSSVSLELEDLNTVESLDELEDLHGLRDEFHLHLPETAGNAGLARKANVTKINLSWVEGKEVTTGVNCDEVVLDAIEDLHGLRDEIHLHLQGLQCVKDKETARKAGLARNANVTKLNLSWAKGIRGETSGVNCDEDVLEGLEPHPNITSLEVHNFLGARFPTWIRVMDVFIKEPTGNRTQLNNLTTVKLLNCSRCETLPKLGQLPQLKCLILSGLCVEFVGIEFYGGDELNMPKAVSFKCLRELEISRFHRLTTWMEPPQIAFPSLETLRIRHCSLLTSIPTLGVKSLVSLELENLEIVESLDIIKYNLGLTSLIMNGLSELASLPEGLANCTKLQILHISFCSNLVSLPKGCESLVNLQSMKVTNCYAMNFIMDDLPHNSSSLRALEIVSYSRDMKIPSSIEKCTLLETLKIRHWSFKISVTHISRCQSLQELLIRCHSAEYLGSILGAVKDLPLLRRLEIYGFSNDKEVKDTFSDITPLLRLQSLTELKLSGYSGIKTLPQQLGLLTRIQQLHIESFHDLEEMTPWICKMSSLSSLILEHCLKLKSLPSKEDLPHLVYLRLYSCKLLEERYAKEGGYEWHKISHISKIIIDHKTIQDIDE